MHSESLIDIARRELEALKCCCGRDKERGRSFCMRCYFLLPKNMRNRLYNTFSEGYADIYDQTKDWLREQDPAWGKSVQMELNP